MIFAVGSFGMILCTRGGGILFNGTPQLAGIQQGRLRNSCQGLPAPCLHAASAPPPDQPVPWAVMVQGLFYR